MITALSVNTGGLGRFGNQCFTIAGVIGIAIKSGQPYGFPEWINQDNKNFGGEADNLNQYFVNPLPPVVTEVPFQHYGYFWGYRDINLPTGSWNIDAHMQSDKFTKHCMPVIREQFRMKDESPIMDAVALHIRFGDYIDDENAHHPVCSKDYYYKAMSHFKKGTEFFVFTDGDVNDVYDRLQDGFNITVMKNDYITDFKLMKRCKHFITANSSFSSFAALLGEHPDKIVIQPSRWFGKSMPHEFDTKDLYHEGSIII